MKSSSFDMSQIGSDADSASHMQVQKYRNELEAERSLSDERLHDIRKLQRQLNEIRNQGHGMQGMDQQKEQDLRRIILDERRRADSEHLIANERLEDIRQLQAQLSMVRGSQHGSHDMTVALKQSDAQVQALAQRESTLKQELQRERAARERAELAGRNKEHDAINGKKELDILKDQYVMELNRHQMELEAWERERAECREREEELTCKLRAKQEMQKTEFGVTIDQGKEREDRLRRAADKEWGVAEDRLNEIRELQRQVTTMHAQLTAAHKQFSDEKVTLQKSYRKEIETIKNQFAGHREAICKQLEEERSLSSERLTTIRSLERQVKDLNEQLASAPEGDDQRFREMQKQTEASLAIYRSDMEDLRRVYKAEIKECEKKLAAEKHVGEERLMEVSSAQRAAAEERSAHRQELEAAQAETENHRAQFKKSEEQLKARLLEKEEALRRQVEIERETADGRLKELHALRSQYAHCSVNTTQQQVPRPQRRAHERARKTAQDSRANGMHKGNSKQTHKQAIETRNREEEARKRVDDLMASREKSLMERERALLVEREEAMNTALRQAASKEDTIRKDFDERAKLLAKKHMEELEYRAGEEQRRVADLERTHKAQLATAKMKGQREEESAAAAAEQLTRAQRENESLRHSLATQKIEMAKVEEDNGRSIDMLQREFQEQLETKRKELTGLQQSYETAQAHSAAVNAAQLEAESQLASLESELARHVSTITVQKEEITLQAAEIVRRTTDGANLQSENEAMKYKTKILAETADGMKPEMAKLAADNCKLKLENTKLQERESRLRQWAERASGTHMNSLRLN